MSRLESGSPDPAKNTLRARNWVVFSSSSGHTFRKVWRALKTQTQEHFRGLFIDRPCSALQVATEFLDPKLIYDFSKSGSKEAFEKAYLDWAQKNYLNEKDAPLILLIGYFRLISPSFLKGASALVNTHPSLLPAFPGLDKKVHEAAFKNSLVSGFSVHLVNEEMDSGPLLFQKAVDTSHCKNAEELRGCVRDVEQKYLPQIIDQLVLCDLWGKDRELSTRELQEKMGLPIKCVD